MCIRDRYQADVARDFNDSLADFKQILGTVRRILVTEILPVFTGFFDVLTDILLFLKENKAFTIGFFSAVSAVIVGTFLPAILSAAAGVFLAILPFLLIGAAVTAAAAAFGVLVDDLYNFLKGNDSVIGEISKKWPIIGDVIKGVADAVKFQIDVMGKAFNLLNEYISSPKKLPEDIISLFNSLKDLSFDDVVSGIAESLPGFEFFLKTLSLIHI